MSWYERHKIGVNDKRKKRIERNRAYLDSVKETNKGCVRCGFSETNKALVFRYVDQEDLGLPITQMVNNAMSIESIDVALDGCQLICLNCDVAISLYALKTSFFSGASNNL